jgi:predicted O-methyltransferase YrrM
MRQRSLDAVLAHIDGRGLDGGTAVDGWLSADQAVRLYHAAAAVQPGGQIVEIGSFRGRSTIVLAGAAPEGVEVVAIDPHAGNDRGPQEISGFASQAADDHAVFTANLAAAGVADRVRHVREFSDDAHDAVTGEIALLYIDGAHRYSPARSDIARWGARVEAGGTMLIHDSFSSIGVTLAIGRELMFGRRFRYVGRSRSLSEYRRDLHGGGAARVGNATRQIAQLPWFAKNLTLKTLLTLRLGPVIERATGRRPEWPY